MNKDYATLMFFKNEFQIIDKTNNENNGSFKYTDVKYIRFERAKTNWLISTLSIIFDLFIGSSTGGRFKDKSYAEIHLENKKLKVITVEENLNNFKKLNEMLKQVQHNKKSN
ncbi:hypothetical protein ACFQ1Q_03805 [Winogradskyella litorisediminis]|uniref:DUF4429 domain-containing protein n=1 Tax=Winogradskyella litorisediminis TaxID=1156618 RepID=A0ABW3N3R4_9FLAO